MHRVGRNTILVARDAGIGRSIGRRHLNVLQLEVAFAAAFEGHEARRCGAALGTGGRTVNRGQRRAFGPNARSGVGRPLTVDDYIADKAHGRVNVIGAARYADGGGVIGRATHGQDESLGKGFYWRGG